MPQVHVSHMPSSLPLILETYHLQAGECNADRVQKKSVALFPNLPDLPFHSLLWAAAEFEPLIPISMSLPTMGQCKRTDLRLKGTREKEEEKGKGMWRRTLRLRLRVPAMSCCPPGMSSQQGLSSNWELSIPMSLPTHMSHRKWPTGLLLFSKKIGGGSHQFTCGDLPSSKF